MNIKNTLKQSVFGMLTAVAGNEERRVRVPVLSGLCRGMRLELDLLTQVEPAYFYGTYDRAVLGSLQSVIKPGWTVWDCGIYLGFYTCFLARQVGAGGRCIAFEPDPRNLRRAKTNVALNGFRHVSFEQLAIAGVSGKIEFVFSGNTNSHIKGVYVGTSMADYQGREVVSSTEFVNSASLGDLLQRPDLARPHLIKIDIEGAELDVLSSSKPEAWKYRPLLLVELHNPQCDSALWDFASRFGYKLKNCETLEPIIERNQVCGTVLCSPRDITLSTPPDINR